MPARPSGSPSGVIPLAGAEPRSAAVDPQSNIERLADQLEKFGRTIDPTDVPLIRSVIDLLVSRLEVDLETKQFEIELAIPSWMGQVLQRPLPRDKTAGLDACLTCKPLIEAHPENREILGVFHCDGEGRPVCYTCHRQRKAA